MARPWHGSLPGFSLAGTCGAFLGARGGRGVGELLTFATIMRFVKPGPGRLACPTRKAAGVTG